MKKASGGRKPPDDPAPRANQTGSPRPGTPGRGAGGEGKGETPSNQEPRTKNELKRQANNTLSAETQVLAWMIAGNTERDIIDGIRETYPGLDPDPLLLIAVKHFAEVGTVGDEALLTTYGWAMEAMKDLYRQMVEIGDYAGAATAVMKVVNLADRAATLQ